MLDWIVPGSQMEAALLFFVVFGTAFGLFLTAMFILGGGLSEFIADWKHSGLVARAEFELAEQQEARMKLRQYRQGDVWIREVAKPLAGAWSKMQKASGKITGAAVKLIARDKGRVILAYGEVTGHAHAIMDKTTEFFQCDDGRKILLVKDDETKLSHEEHGTITIPKGEYEIVQQREYDPELHSVQVLD